MAPLPKDSIWRAKSSLACLMPSHEDRRSLWGITANGEEFARVLCHAADAHFKVQMGAGGTTGGTDIGDMLAALDDVAHFDEQLRSMRIACHQVIAMIDLDHIAELIMIFRCNHHTGSSRYDWRADWRRKIQALMEGVMTAKRI